MTVPSKDDLSPGNPAMGPAQRASPLLTDLYQLNMMQAYLDRGETKTATFEMFFRKLPARRGFLVAAGLEQALEFLETVSFGAEDLEWLARSGRFSRDFIDYLGQIPLYRRRARPRRGHGCSFPTSRSCA